MVGTHIYHFMNSIKNAILMVLNSQSIKIPTGIWYKGANIVIQAVSLPIVTHFLSIIS